MKPMILRNEWEGGSELPELRRTLLRAFYWRIHGDMFRHKQTVKLLTVNKPNLN